VGRCGDCHTPRTWLGAPDPDRFLAGSAVGSGGKKVPNITPHPQDGIGDWNEDHHRRADRKHTPDFDLVGGAMSEIVRTPRAFATGDRVYLRRCRLSHSRSTDNWAIVSTLTAPTL
jgi:hypothetical protein